jgi:hypothetical protein
MIRFARDEEFQLVDIGQEEIKRFAGRGSFNWHFFHLTWN